MESTTNYQIIKDEATLKKFIDWLPVLERNETYYVCLMVRSKYCVNFPHIRSDKIQLKRFTSNKERLFSKIQQLECAEGTYLQKELEVPQEGLALYITPNPRNVERATKNCLIKFANLITQPYYGYNPHQEVLSEIQKAGGTKYFIDFDFDNVAKLDSSDFIRDTLDRFLGIINVDCLKVLETRGGLHVLVELSKVDPFYKNTWHQDIRKIPGCDQVSADGMIPIPGCTQGNFIPKLYDYEVNI